MSEYRQDPLSRRWVIIGGDRAARPNEFVEAATRAGDLPCPFCAGNEAETPPAIAIYPPGAAQWLTRAVPNKFPALTSDQPLFATCRPLDETNADDPAPGFGRHEVIIESPRHVASLSGLRDDEATWLFRAYRERLRAFELEKAFRYVQIFKNAGPAAGASLEHSHSQLVALPGIPEALTQELQSSHDFFAEHQRSLLGHLLEGELAGGERIVAQTPAFAAFCPFASRFPFEVWIAPRRHAARFQDAQDSELGELALLVRELVGCMERVIGKTAYNFFLHTQPFDSPQYDHYHWHFELFPRFTKVAGFEWSTGCFINPYPPEAAARLLRGAAAAPQGASR